MRAMSHFSDDQGKMAVKASRQIIESYIRGEQLPKLDLPDIFDMKGGVFVTIKSYPKHELRGCIGYPEPIAPLREALVDSAISAASRDPRFPPVSSGELSRITVEVSLLTPPEPVEVSDPKELLSKITIGEDGLIVERGGAKGLLLPQVPVEWNWEVEQFLEHTCVKAGLPPNAWKGSDTRFLKFQAEVFSEEEPNGEIKSITLSD